MNVQEMIKKIILYLLALIAFCVCSMIVIAIFNTLLKLDMNVAKEGTRCGIISWAAKCIFSMFHKRNTMED